MLQDVTEPTGRSRGSRADPTLPRLSALTRFIGFLQLQRLYRGLRPKTTEDDV